MPNDDSLYVKLDNHTEYRQSVTKIEKLLDELDTKMDRLREIREEEEEYLDSWEGKSETVRDKLEEASEILDANRPA